ncbi:MAG: hypothetical protein GC161_08595 [Planctomycetaceae bacterium]|nr:hypothetical protein [Planctomycetaceae bacterium]
MPHASLLTLLLALAPPALANDPELVPDPLTRFGWLLDEGETFTGLTHGDLNGDGRMDLAATTSDGRLVAMSAVAERQHHRILETEPPEEDEDTPGTALHLAVQGCAGADRILVETDNGLWQGTVTVDEDGRWVWGYERLDEEVGGRVLYDNRGAHIWSLGWRVSTQDDWVQALLFDRATGALLLAGPHLEITAPLGPVELVDYDGDHLCELAVTVPSGCAVLDTAGNVLVQSLRATIQPDPSADCLVRIRDASGAELLGWMHGAGSDAELRLVSSSSSTQTVLLPDLGSGARLFAAELSGSALADLVLVGDGSEDPRLYRAKTTTPRYDATAPEFLEVAAATEKDEAEGLLRGGLFADLDRDGDLDYAAVTDTVLQLARLDEVDDGELVPTVDITSGGPNVSSSTFVSGTPHAVPVTVLLQPAAWTTHPTLATANRIEYRVYADATLDPLERGAEPAHTGTITNLTWPVSIPWSTVLPQGQLTAASGADSIWYVELELVATPQVGVDVRFPTAAFAIAPDLLDMIALELACAPGGELWNGPSPNQNGNGTFGTTGHAPRIPRLPPPPPPPQISQPGGN